MYPLKEDDGASLTPDRPVEYESDELAANIDYLAQLPQKLIASDLGLTVRGWSNLIKRISQPRDLTAERIAQIVAKYRAQEADNGAP